MKRSKLRYTWVYPCLRWAHWKFAFLLRHSFWEFGVIGENSLEGSKALLILDSIFRLSRGIEPCLHLLAYLITGGHWLSRNVLGSWAHHCAWACNQTYSSGPLINYNHSEWLLFPSWFADEFHRWVPFCLLASAVCSSNTHSVASALNQDNSSWICDWVLWWNPRGSPPFRLDEMSLLY